jgi:hypothetical protein
MTARLDAHPGAQLFRIRTYELEAFLARVEHRVALSAAALKVVGVIELDPTAHGLLAVGRSDHGQTYRDGDDQQRRREDTAAPERTARAASWYVAEHPRPP